MIRTCKIAQWFGSTHGYVLTLPVSLKKRQQVYTVRVTASPPALALDLRLLPDRQLLADKQVRFAGYMQPHPLENKIHIKVREAD